MASRAIVPRMLTRLANRCPSAAASWSALLRLDPERYLAPDVRHGLAAPLPATNSHGLGDVHARRGWNRTATVDCGLPGETWREVVARREHVERVIRRLRSPEPVGVGELISLNVELETLVADWLESDKTARAAMRDENSAPLAVLDPTCGSGAFLSAALRVLERLYEASALASGAPAAAAILRDHLHGVDLLPEAVEACRLRLLLELLARSRVDASPAELPDVARTIRCGNALLGHARETQSHGPGAHATFDWPREFPRVMQHGGFDVIVGNPPYVEYTRAGVDYPLAGQWRTRRCDNLHALVAERSADLLKPDGALALIVPAASVCTPRMQPLVALLLERFGGLWLSLYDERPGKLFPGVDQQLAIVLAHDAGPCRALCVTPMRHWWTRPHDERPRLFATLAYEPLPPDLRVAGVIPKIGTPLELKLLDKLARLEPLAWRAAEGDDAAAVYYKNAGGRYWRLVKSFPTRYASQRGTSRTSTELKLRVRRELLPAVVCCLSSSLFYWYWRVASNCRHLTQRELAAFPLPHSLAEPPALRSLHRLRDKYERCLRKTLLRKTTNNARSGRIVQDEYRAAAAKPILDEIDRALAPHYGLTAEELDFVINYDLKYRLAGRRSSATTPPAPANGRRSRGARAPRGSPAS
jgi:hypothetical protein